MRCRQARTRLNDKSEFDRELLEHLQGCPTCSQLVAAQEILQNAFGASRHGEIAEPTPLAAVRAGVATRFTKEEHSIMATLKNTLTSHPRLGFGLAVGVLALLFFVLVPLPYQRTSGYDLRLSGFSAEFPEAEFSQALDALGYTNLSMNVTAGASGSECFISKLPSLKAAREVVAAFNSMSGLAALAKITPRFETVSGSLYAQARERMVQIEVDGTGKTDEQIKAEIEAKLAAQGFDKPLVYIKSEPGGKREIKMELREVGDSSAPRPPQQTLEIDTRGKTDAQVQQEIRDRLAAQGISGAEVSMTSSGPDSSREVRLEIQIQDTTEH